MNSNTITINAYTILTHLITNAGNVVNMFLIVFAVDSGFQDKITASVNN